MSNVHSTKNHLFVAPSPVEPVHSGTRPSFSIITAAYNAAKTIGEAMESAFAQTLQPHEVIVVDDGSTDNTVEALAPWLDRICLVRTPNQGVSAARNDAARRATGDFLSILDADDVFMPDRLQLLADLAIARPDLDLLVSNVRYEQPKRPAKLFYRRDQPFPVDDQRKAIIGGCFPQHPCVRRTTFEQYGGFDESLVVAEDWELWLRQILGGSRVGLVDLPLMRYRKQASGLTSDIRRLIQSNQVVYQRSLDRDDLSESEREVARSGVLQSVQLLELLDTHETLARRHTEGRARAFAAARNSDYPVSTRLRAAIATVAPRLSGRRLVRRGAAQQNTENAQNASSE